MLEIHLLGQFEVLLDGESVEIPSRPAQSLLAYLALNPGVQHRREKLAGLLWPESDEANARSNLRHALWRLRKEISGEFFVADKVSIVFNSDAEYELDVDILEEEAIKSRSTDDLVRAVSVYKGELLPGFYGDWVTLDREGLCAVFEDRIQMLLDRLIENGEWQDALKWGEHWIRQGQIPESAYRALMIAHSAVGELSKVAAAYQRCVDVLHDELSVDPSKETRELYERLTQGEKPVGVSIVTTRHNLPIQPTTFIGRKEELAEIGKLLGNPSCRLLTLVGPGGIGKTRLALQAASKRAEDYAHGAYFVPLAPIESADYIVPTIADSIQFSFDSAYVGGEPKAQLLNYLREKMVLLLMDNFEHLLEGAGLLADLLELAPEVKILVTSRERLNLPGEWAFDVLGMKYPTNGGSERIENFSAMELFIERARQAHSGFVLSEEEKIHVMRICQLVEGMPLGVELASAWVPVISCKEIADEIKKNFDFLSTSMRDVPEKHRSLRAAFDHSWKLLSDEQREIFQKLSIFCGGFKREAAQIVAGANLRFLSVFVNKSLLRRNTLGRYEMHELLRQYTEEKLNAEPVERDKVHDLRSSYYLSFIYEREEEMQGERQREVIEEILEEIENIRAGWRWALTQEKGKEVLKALNSLLIFYTIYGWHEGEVFFNSTAQAVKERCGIEDLSREPESRVYSMALVGESFLASLLGNHAVAEEIAQSCLPALRDLGLQKELAYCLISLANNAMNRGDYVEAKQLFEEGIAIAEEITEHWPIGHGLLLSGWNIYMMGDYEGARRQFKDCLKLFKERGDQRGVAYCLSKLGLIADAEEQYKEAMKLHQDSLDYFERIGDQVGRAYAISRQSLCAYGLGEYTDAKQYGHESYMVFKEVGSQWGMTVSLCRIGFAVLALGESLEAKNHFLEALESAMGIQAIPLALLALVGLAILHAEEGKMERAVELLTFIKHHPAAQWQILVRAKRALSSLETKLTKEVLTAAKEKGKTSELDEIVEGILKE